MKNKPTTYYIDLSPFLYDLEKLKLELKNIILELEKMKDVQ